MKDEIAKEKTRKYKLSLKNSKHMNQTVLSNHKIDTLEKQSYRNSILIEEVKNDVIESNQQLRKLKFENEDTVCNVNQNK